MRILYAEDERDLNDLVTRRLVAEGYGVDSCLDGQQAWDIFRPPITTRRYWTS